MNVLARSLAVVTLLALALVPHAVGAAATCTFDRGITTCSTVAQSTETQTHTAISGCLYGPAAIPSRRERVFEDVYLVTTTTTTLQHGKEGPVYDSQTSSTRALQSSRLVSDTCLPPG
jgi:hypothetical protein